MLCHLYVMFQKTFSKLIFHLLFQEFNFISKFVYSLLFLDSFLIFVDFFCCSFYLYFFYSCLNLAFNFFFYNFKMTTLPFPNINAIWDYMNLLFITFKTELYWSFSWLKSFLVSDMNFPIFFLNSSDNCFISEQLRCCESIL